MANTTNVSTLTTDFNVTPYYDDYDATKNFYRILFKPGYAVQARELTQAQTILQKQIDRFGKHVFKEGSIVLPGAFTLETNYGQIKGDAIPFVKVKDSDNANSDVNISSFHRETVRGLTSNISASIVEVADGQEGSSNTKTIFVRYLTTSASNNDVKTFAPGEVLVSNAGSTLVVLNNDPVANIGLGSRFQIDEGVFFAKEHFISFPTSSVILEKYNPNPNCKVGFLVTEDIVGASQDASLLDPALESSNFSAPGADRFRMSTELQVRPYEDNEGPPNFVTLFTIKNGVVQTYFEKSQYNILNDRLAERTYEESGDYYVSGLSVQVREHDDNGSNFGRFANGNNQLLFVGVDPGTAYVRGYRVQTYDITELQTDKATSFSGANNQVGSTTMGSYVTANELTGSWELDKGNRIFLYDVAQNRLSEKKWSVGSQTGNIIGSAVLHSVEYVSGNPGYDANYNIYLADITMNGTNSFADVRSLYLNNSPHSDLGADIILNSANNAVLNDINKSALLYYVGTDYTRNLKTIGTSTTDTNFSFNRTDGVSSTVQISTGGTTTITISPGDEIFPYGTSSLGASDKRDITVVLGASQNITMSGTVSANSGSGNTTTLTGVSTAFTRLNVGDKLEFAGKSNTVYITAIASDSSLSVNETLPPGLSGNTFFKAYKVGDNIDLTGKGSAAGTTRTVSATPTTITIDLKESFASAIDCTVTYQLKRTSAQEVTKILRPNRFVKISCATAGTTGPFSLGFSDVYQIRNVIRKTGSAPTSLTDGTNVTTSFVFDNGQRDTHYDIATITPRSVTLGATDFLLVELDYFSPNFSSRAGYFSIDSYPIQDDDTLSSNTTIRTEQIPVFRSPLSGVQHDLRNHIDFRPVKSITANDTQAVASSTTNPGASNTYNFSSSLRFPVPSTEYTYDYTYYLARKDLVVVDKNGIFSVIKGNPAVVPTTPPATENMMVVASLDVAPYPSLSPAYANSIGKKNLAVRTRKLTNVRFTMRDIGVLKDRIQNLEYYASLSLLEKSAYDLRILDSDGLDRFKNGIFVDTFRDHLLGASDNNPDYRIVVDSEEMSIRPLYTMESVGYDYLSGTNVVKNSNLVTLDYTEVELLSQTNVTNIRNVERTSYLFIGRMYLTPPQDIWVDTSYAPDETVSIHSANSLLSVVTSAAGADQLASVIKNIISVTWGAWGKYATGYVLYTGTGAERTAVGTYSTYEQARQEANRFLNATAVTIETLWNNVRPGTQRFSLTSYDQSASGYKVIDTSEIPYIRPQTIAAVARGLKPFSKMRAFFDGIEVTNYVTPLTEAQYNAIVDGIETTLPPGPMAAEGSDLIVSEAGEVYFNFRIDENLKFRTGTKNLIIIDGLYNNDIQNAFGPDASTGAKEPFIAKGTKVIKQRTIYSTSGYTEAEEEVEESYASNSFEVIPQIVPRGGRGSCVAYSFTPKAPKSEEGIFLTSVDIFVARKSATRGIWFEIREMNSAGGITRSQVPFSEVWYTNAEIPISTDGKTNPLTVTFDAPVFLMNNVQYAFIVHSENADPDTYVWISRLGETDVNTQKQVSERPFTGTFYTTNNNLNWDIVPDVDLVCIFRRADFSTGVVGQAIIGNRPIERFYLSNVSSSLSARVGDVFMSGDRITISAPNGTNTIAITDKFRGNVSTSNANGSVVRVLSATQFILSNTNYSLGEKIDVYDANGFYRGITASVAAVANTRAVLTYFKETSVNTFADFKNSTGGFYANDIIRSMSSNSFTAKIDSIRDFRYSTVSFEPSYLNFTKSEITFEMRTYANGSTTQGSYFFIDPSETYYFNTEQSLSSRSNEITNLSGNRSNQIRVNMRTTSNVVSPVLDLERTHTVYIDTIINSNVVGETAATGGNLFNKYISKTVTLADGQDAEDLQVSLTAYRPPSTDVRIWAKILNAEDGETFAQKNWIELEKTGDGDIAYSSLANRDDFLEYTFKFPSSIMTGTTIGGASNTVAYVNSSGTSFSGYKYFAIKIGLLGTNSAVVPRVADLKCIALQM
jgi:hypothetical protein